MLSLALPKSGKIALTALRENAIKPLHRVWAQGSPFEVKDTLKARGYEWNDGSNGKPYVAVGRLLIDRGELPREKVTMATIRGWMKAHPKEGAALRRENPSYVFFREITGPGPLGAQRVVLTPGRNFAIDFDGFSGVFRFE